MPTPPDKSWPGLPIEEDMVFQRRTWRVERVGWAAMALIVLTAFLGFFGAGGPFSRRTLAAEDVPLEVDIPAYSRREASVELVIRLKPGAAVERTQLWLSGAFLDSFQIEGIVPRPVEARPEGDGLLHVFAAGGAPAATVHLYARCQTTGIIDYRVGTGPQHALAVRQYVYP